MDLINILVINKEYAVNQFVSGKDFIGLGPMAKAIVRNVATECGEMIRNNDCHVVIPEGEYKKLESAQAQNFVISVLFEGVAFLDAVDYLVKTVYGTYMNEWTK